MDKEFLEIAAMLLHQGKLSLFNWLIANHLDHKARETTTDEQIIGEWESLKRNGITRHKEAIRIAHESPAKYPALATIGTSNGIKMAYDREKSRKQRKGIR